MKTTILATALLLSTSIMAQKAAVQTTADVKVKAKTETNGQKSAAANGQVQANQSVETAGTIEAAKEGVATTSGKVKAKAEQGKEKAKAKVEQTASATNELVEQTSVNSDIQSNVNVVAGKDNPVQLTGDLVNNTTVSPAAIKTVTTGNKSIEAPVKTIQASSATLLSNGTMVQPKPLAIKNKLITTNSTLLKLK